MTSFFPEYIESKYSLIEITLKTRLLLVQIDFLKEGKFECQKGIHFKTQPGQSTFAFNQPYLGKSLLNRRNL